MHISMAWNMIFFSISSNVLMLILLRRGAPAVNSRFDSVFVLILLREDTYSIFQICGQISLRSHKPPLKGEGDRRQAVEGFNCTFQ